MSTVSLNLKYRVLCADEDPANECRMTGPGGKIRESDRGKVWKWVFKAQLPRGFITEYDEWVKEAGSRDVAFDHSELMVAVGNIPYLPNAQVVVIDVTVNHIGNGNGFPRLQTCIHAAFQFKDGKAVREFSHEDV